MTPRELDVASAYAMWAREYPPFAHNAFMRAEERSLLELLPDARDCIALDLACGSGRYARILRERGAAKVFGLDLSTEMLAKTNTCPCGRCEGKRMASFVQSNLPQLPFTNYSFDLIVCGLAIGHIEKLAPAFGEIARVLKRGGTFLYSDFHPRLALAGARREFSVNGSRFAVKHFTHRYADHVAALRSAGLQITGVREPIIGTDIQENFSGDSKWSGLPGVLVIRAEKLNVA
ncbi:MAG: class I SAM-dependent methyltransferase [Chloroflexi bacterium]|nr:class I SAM-dependent methyltransferase [Chloroflexota bacterium]